MAPDRAPLRHLPDPIPITLLEAREALGWSQRAAAQHTGVSRGMLQHLEHGRRVPSRDVADALIAAYRLDTLAPLAAAQLRRIAVTDAGRCRPSRPAMAPMRHVQGKGAPYRLPAGYSLADVLPEAAAWR